MPATMPELAALSNIMVSETASIGEIENAKTAIRRIMTEVTPEDHMHIAIDVLATLRERDMTAFLGVIETCVIWVALSKASDLTFEPPF